jgi:16S rRNA (guanine527-N7)-methyltransferase
VPGIPLAIVRPDAGVVLIESTRKKASFLALAAKDLGLSNVEVVCGRAEEVARTQRRESFDVVSARAVGALAMLVEWCLPLVKKGGKLLAMKGQRIAEELPIAQAAIKRLNGGGAVVHAVQGLGGAEHHVIVEVPKLGRTDARYPRPATVAKGKPLA